MPRIREQTLLPDWASQMRHSRTKVVAFGSAHNTINVSNASYLIGLGAPHDLATTSAQQKGARPASISNQVIQRPCKSRYHRKFLISVVIATRYRLGGDFPQPQKAIALDNLHSKSIDIAPCNVSG